MKWNTEGLQFLYQPDVFTGSFDNEKMQQRHEQEVQRKLASLKDAISRDSCPLSAMKRLNTREHLLFLHNNLEAFRQKKKLEEAVMFLYTRLNAPFSSGGDYQEWSRLFMICEPQLLAALGSPVPFNRTTVYQGSVSGFKRSLSWTPERERAEKFASRWKDPAMGGGQIYEVDISAEDVLVYMQRSREDEIILSPKFIEDADIRNFTA